jgi:OmpA-OmpF porin, OOP family
LVKIDGHGIGYLRFLQEVSMRVLIGGVLVALMAGGPAVADVAGSADHPAVPRYEGAEIVRYEALQFDEYALRTAALAAEVGAVLPLEGKVTRITYAAPAGRSVLEVFRNYEAALGGAGFRTLFDCEKQACGDVQATIEAGGPLSVLLWGSGDHRYLAGQLPRDEGDLFVSLFVTRNFSGGALKDLAMIQLDVVEIAPMEDRMVFLDPGTMSRELGTAGKVALYGVQFDFNSDVVKPDSAPQLEAIAELLRGAPEMNLMVVGHTDASGSSDYNLELSRRRAAAVVAALTSSYGIAADRLTATGVGMAAPVASNRTGEGQALNRRVELVEW